MKTTETNIGRWVEVLHNNLLWVGTVMDEVAGTNTPKRIRIQRGYLQGTVLVPSQYQFRSWVDETEVDP